MSAKTGDNVSQCFFRVAADLAGVVLTKPELEVSSKIVKAQIVNYPQEHADPAIQPYDILYSLNVLHLLHLHIPPDSLR